MHADIYYVYSKMCNCGTKTLTLVHIIYYMPDK